MIDIRMAFKFVILMVAVLVFLYGLKKFHFKYSLLMISKKEKIVSIGILGIQYFFMIYILACSEILSTREFFCIEIAYVAFLVLAEILIAMAIKNFAQKFNKNLMLYYIVFVFAVDLSVYLDCKSFAELAFDLTFAMILYCLSVCIKEKFTAKKVVYIAMLLIVLLGCVLHGGLNGISYIDVLRNMFISLVIGGMLAVAQNLRVVLRKMVTIITLVLVVVVQLMVVI